MEILIDFDKLAKIQAEEEKKGGGSKDFYLNQKNLPIAVKLMPGHPNFNGLPYVHEIQIWVNGKPYTSPKTFGEPCSMLEEISEAYALVKADEKKYKDLKSLLDSWTFGSKDSFIFPVIQLNADSEGMRRNKLPKEDAFSDNCVKTFSCGKQMKESIMSIVMAPAVVDSVDMFRQTSYPLNLSKTGEKMKTEYSATQWIVEVEVPSELYTLEKVPDIVSGLKKRLKDSEYCRAIVRNYLYGEPLPENPDSEEETENEVKSENTKSENKATGNPLLDSLSEQSKEENYEDLPF